MALRARKYPSNSVWTAMLPVVFAPPGKTGMMPIMLFTNMKKNTVSRYGAYFALCSPGIEPFITSSFMNVTTGSIIAASPDGASFSTSCLRYHLEHPSTSRTSIRLFIISPATFFVTDMSNGLTSLPEASFSTIFPSYFPPSAM